MFADGAPIASLVAHPDPVVAAAPSARQHRAAAALQVPSLSPIQSKDKCNKKRISGPLIVTFFSLSFRLVDGSSDYLFLRRFVAELCLSAAAVTRPTLFEANERRHHVQQRHDDEEPRARTGRPRGLAAAAPGRHATAVGPPAPRPGEGANRAACPRPIQPRRRRRAVFPGAETGGRAAAVGRATGTRAPVRGQLRVRLLPLLSTRPRRSRCWPAVPW